MNTENITAILTILSTMKGYPPMPALRPDETMDPLRMTYLGLLSRIPDALARTIRNDILLRFDERPSVKNLAEWARSLGPQKPFDIRQLDAGAYREGGPCRPGTPALAALTGEGKSGDGKTPVPTSAKAVIEALRQKEQAQHRGNSAALPTGDYGLEYFYPDGKTERFPARHSEAEAQARRAEVCFKYSHFTCRVYRKSV